MVPPSLSLYAGSVNPPRRAKRIHSSSGKDTTAHPSRDDDLDSDMDHDDYNDSDDELTQRAPSAAAPAQAPPPARRGRKPGTLSRAAREAQRKMNHSLIEKARRTKINDALATLRRLVPADYKREGDEEDRDGEQQGEQPGSSGKAKTKKEEKEKEFKLEILVRTVTYLEDLSAKVKLLEEQQHSRECSSCAAAQAPPPSKRKKTENNHERSSVPDSALDPALRSTSTDVANRLPPISSFLARADSHQQAQGASQMQMQLPSPPLSGTIQRRAPDSSAPAPPALTLPSPNPFTVLAHGRGYMHAQGRSPEYGNGYAYEHAHTHAQPLSGPSESRRPAQRSPRSLEDESAASLLLQMSARAQSRSPKSAASFASSSEAVEATHHQAQTPGSMLGLTRR